MMTPINFGIVGYGYWGPNLARNFNALTRGRLSAVCDLNAGRLDRMHNLYPNATAYADFGQMLRDSAIDAIVAPLR